MKPTKKKYHLALEPGAHTRLKVLAAESHCSPGDIVTMLVQGFDQRVSAARKNGEVPKDHPATPMNLWLLLSAKDQGMINETELARELADYYDNAEWTS